MEGEGDQHAGLELPPVASFLMYSLRSLGYSLHSALADLVDNSIAAGATQVSIDFGIGGSPSISVLDNGCGMTAETLVTSMRFGSMDPRANRGIADLGRFGLGMKTASLSQCRRFTVVSGRNGNFNAARWDLDESERRRAWWLIRPGLDELDVQALEPLLKQNQGTVIIWEAMDRLSATGTSNPRLILDRLVVEAADHLALVFHRFLAGEIRGQFEITLNGRPLPRLDPFLEGHARGQSLHCETFMIEGHPVTVSPFVLPFPSSIGEAELARAGGREGLKTGHGFYIYRGGRLVVPGGWFRIVPSDQLTRLARVRVDVPVALDHLWKVDIRKAASEPPQALRDHLKRIVGTVAERSRRVYTYKGTSHRHADHLPTWQRHDGRGGAAQWLVNREHPVVAAAFRPQAEPRDVERLIRLLEEGLPSHEIHLHISNDLPVAEQQPVDTAELHAILSRLVEAFKDSPEMLNVLRERLPMMEPFSRNPEQARELAARFVP